MWVLYLCVGFGCQWPLPSIISTSGLFHLASVRRTLWDLRVLEQVFAKVAHLQFFFLYIYADTSIGRIWENGCYGFHFPEARAVASGRSIIWFHVVFIITVIRRHLSKRSRTLQVKG